MPTIAKNDLSLLFSVAHLFRVIFENKFHTTMSHIGGGGYLPSEVNSTLLKMTDLYERLRVALNQGEDLTVDDDETALVKQIIVRSRLKDAQLSDEKAQKTFHGELLDTIWSRVRQYDEIMTRDWFLRAAHLQLPKVTDFFPIKYARSQDPGNYLADEIIVRDFDEKFHILQAPKLFYSDLHEFRQEADLRELCFAVAFFDVDDFKTWNEEFTEPKVDRDVLPTLMRCIESHVYKRGYAYRQGGDEYLILVYNTPEKEALEFIDSLRMKISKLKFAGTNKSITVSAGVVCGDESCYFTNRELEAKAAEAKKIAKTGGKNCTATFRTVGLESQEIYIWQPSGEQEVF